MKKVILYVHGKGGNAKEADHYIPLCQGYDVVGLDYKSTTPWETKEELLIEYHKLSKRYDSIMIIANSIGAYFTMNALANTKIDSAYFISPIVDMEKLILDMMNWANVTEEELCDKKEIETSFGETLSWKYLCYVRENPINWMIPTHILYARNDHLTSNETMLTFVDQISSTLTIMEDGEHWFHTDKQIAFLDDWLMTKIK